MKIKSMTVNEILELAKENHVDLWVENNQLKFKCYHQKLSPEFRQLLIEHKDYLKAALQGSVQKADKNALISASAIQKKLYFLQKINSHSYQYNIPITLELSGSLNISHFVKSFNQLVKFHEVLRGYFVEQNDFLEFKVSLDVENTLELIDLRNMSPTAIKDQCDVIILENSKQVFDLNKPPLLSAKLILCRDDYSILAFCIHHILMDGNSVLKFITNLAWNYQIEIPKPSYQFGDYLAWKFKTHQLPAYRSQREYWINQLKNPPQELCLPLDKRRLSLPNFKGDIVSIEIDENLINRLKSYIGEKNRGSLFILFLSAYMVLLKRYCQQNDIIIGIPSLNTPLPEFEDTLGIFINTLPIRHHFTDLESFNDLVQSITETVLAAQENQDFEFENLNKVLFDQPHAVQPSLFHTLFHLETPMDIDDIFIDLKAKVNIINNHTAKFDLSLSVHEHEVYRCDFEYNTDLFSQDTIQRIAKHFRRILELLPDHADQDMNRLMFLSPDEQNFLIYDLNRTQSLFNKNIQIQNLFELVSSSHSEDIAVSDLTESFSFNQLNCQANQLAAYLSYLNIQVEDRVLVIMDRCNTAIVAWLAILKCGGTFVPIDPDYPSARINHILLDTGAKFCITKTQFRAKISADSLKFILLDEIKLNHFPTDNPPVKTAMENLAYIIYTSGSTGKPKGVMIPHVGISHYVQWAIEYYQFTRGCGAPVHSSLAFDLTLTSIFCSLCSGRRIFLVHESLGFEGLVNQFVQHKNYSLIKLTPAHLKLLQTQLTPQALAGLDLTLVIGGEALYYEDLLFWHNHVANIRLINEYGPTEITVANIVYEPADKDFELLDSRTVPIGKPINNSQAWILDEYLNVQPIGVIGEIYLAGAGLARGYLNQPQLSAQKFLDNPFPGFAHTKMYKTGDLGRVLADGNIEYLGRSDNQVKVRGFRIELEEIKSVIEKISQVKQAAVTVKTNLQGQDVIVAYIILRHKPISIEYIRESILKELPHYMAPSYFICIDNIPLSINGKIDYKQLPEPTQGNLLELSTYAPPITREENILAKIWGELLKIDQVGRNDNFFALGGDSIITIQMITKAREAGLQLRTKQLLTQQTIAELAAVSTKIEEELTSFMNEKTGDIPLTPIQKWFFALDLKNINYFNQAMLFKTNLRLDITAVKKALDQITFQFETFKIRFEYQNGAWRQFYSDQLRHYDLYEYHCPENLSDIFNQLHQSMDIINGPIMQVALISGANDGMNRLFIAIHHLYIDGISWRIFMDNFWRAYCLQPLRSSSLSYKFWSKALSASINQFVDEIPFWTSISSAANNFPVTKSKTFNDSGPAYEEKCFQLNTDYTEKLLTQANRAYQTHTQDLLLTALILTSALHVGQRKLIFKCEGHGREECISEMDISNTIGWFTNIYPVILAIPLEIDISDKYTDYTSVITQIKEQIRKIPNKGIGYGILKYLYDSSPIKNLLDLNQINLTFNYLGQFDFDTESSGHELIESDETPGISISPENQPITLIEINCWISNARFYINIGYSARHFSNQFVEDFGNQYIQVLKNVINHCIQQRKLFHTVSDFPLVSISENELNELQNSAVVEDIYPLSPLQKEMLYHHQQVAECDAYLTQIQWFQNQKLDADAYRAAWQTVIDHIPVLRTGFLPSMQVVYKDVTLDWQHYNLEMQDPTDIEHIISDFLVSDRKNNFDLTSHSLMRITLIFLPDNRQLVIWTHHHIILDGWSIPIILNLLNDYYQKYIQCSSVKLLRYVPEFKDYIKWFGTNNQTEILSFWKNKFKNLKYPVTISGTKFNLYGNNHFIQKQSYLLSEDEYQFINKFCKKNHLTMNIFMQLAWALVIAINAKSTDVVYSLIHAGRLPEFPDCDKIIGLCANILPIRIQFSAPQTFIDVLRSIQTYLNEINDHGNINQREIFRLINPELDINITESLFIFENYPIEMQQLASLNFNIKMNYPIQVVFVPRHQSLAIELVHDKNIPDCRISKLLSDLRSIINTISQDSQVSIKQFFPALFEENFIFNYHPGYAKKKWFFIHPSGCGAESYLPLALNCPEHIALYAIDSYHLKVGVDDFNSIEQLAQFYASQILEIQSQGPFYLGGWSFGGLVALEIAQILTKNGKIVNDLVVFDSFINTNKLFHNSSFQKFSENMIMSSRYYQELSQGPQYNVLLTMRKEANMIANYYPRPYLGRVSLFKAMELPEPNNFEVMKDLLAQPQNGWETLASQLNVYHLNTHHWQIFSSQEWDLINSVLS